MELVFIFSSGLVDVVTFLRIRFSIASDLPFCPHRGHLQARGEYFRLWYRLSKRLLHRTHFVLIRARIESSLDQSPGLDVRSQWRQAQATIRCLDGHQTHLRSDVGVGPNLELTLRLPGGSECWFSGYLVFGCEIGKPPNRQGAAFFNQGIDLLNQRIASETVSGVRLEFACRRWQ